jgi:hypothetical protein
VIATDPDLPAAVAPSTAARPWTTTDVVAAVGPPEATALVARIIVAATGTAALEVLLLAAAAEAVAPGTTTKTVATVARLLAVEVRPWTTTRRRATAVTKIRIDVTTVLPTHMPMVLVEPRTTALPMTDLLGTSLLAMAATDRAMVATLAMTTAEAGAGAVDTGNSCFHSLPLRCPPLHYLDRGSPTPDQQKTDRRQQPSCCSEDGSEGVSFSLIWRLRMVRLATAWVRFLLPKRGGFD